MMMCAAAALLALLLSYLASSEGALSPPLNLSVELLDFKALARWLPGPRNPKGTRYSLEFIDIEHFTVSPWYRAGDCTNITLTQCYLIINRRIQTEHFMRVVAEWEEERSEWMYLPRSFQPYTDTLLSAPKLTVSTEQHSISVSLSHPVQSLTEVRMRFSVDLFQMSSNNMAEKHIVQNITTRSSHFTNLPFGNYCINASAFLTARSKCNTNATACVLLLQNHKGKVWVVIMGVLLLLSILAVIGLIFMYCYMKPFKKGCIPKALHIIEGTGMVLTVNSEELCTLPLSLMFTDDSTAACQMRSDENSSQGYFGRAVWRGSGKVIKYGSCSEIMDEADQDVPPACDLYSTAAKIEDTDERSTQTEYHAGGLTPRSSFSGLSLPSGQNAEIENTLDSDLDTFDKENSWSFYVYSEQKDSSEGETDSIHSEFVFESNYEPRPDLCWMLNHQFGSQ